MYKIIRSIIASFQLSEGLASVVATSRAPPAHYQSRGQSPDIDYKILAENILKSSEMQKTLNDWLSEQSHLLEKNQKYKSADPDVITESFKQFLSEELDDRENKNKESLQQSIQQKVCTPSLFQHLFVSLWLFTGKKTVILKWNF